MLRRHRGEGRVPSSGDTSLSGALAGHAAALAAAPATPDVRAVRPDVLVRAVIAWTQLFGMISFELFGQFVGSFDPPDAFFAHAVAQFASFVGLREPAD